MFMISSTFMLSHIQVTIGNLSNIGAASDSDPSTPVSSRFALLTKLGSVYEQVLPELPIDMTQWEKAGRIVSMETTVLEFLRRDRTKAYSGKEVGNEVMKDPLMKPMTGAAIVACVIMTLDSLFRQGKVDVRKLDRIVYYKASGEET